MDYSQVYTEDSRGLPRGPDAGWGGEEPSGDNSIRGKGDSRVTESIALGRLHPGCEGCFCRFRQRDLSHMLWLSAISGPGSSPAPKPFQGWQEEAYMTCAPRHKSPRLPLELGFNLTR